MDTSINLLLSKDEESIKRLRRIKAFNFVSAVFAVGLGVISLVTFLLIQTLNLSGIKREQQKAIREISQFQDRRAKLFVLNNRVDNIEKILEERKDLAKAMGSLLAKTPIGLSIEDLEVDANAIILRASSPSLLAIGELINNLTDMVRKKEIIRSLTLSSLVFEEGRNSYQISIRSEL